MTISFSYAYLKGLERLIVSSPCVVTAVQRPRRATSPRRTECQLEVKTRAAEKVLKYSLFIRTVSAMSSALCPVTMCSMPSSAAPRSSA